MARPKKNPDTEAEHGKMVGESQGKALPETLASGDTDPSVKDLPPANPLGEPVKPVEEYADISEAGKQAAALGIETEETADVEDYIAGETVVEHPLSPTDANPNPHGQRQTDADATVIETDDKGVSRREVRSEDDTVEVTGADDLAAEVHLGDGRTIAAGQKQRVSKDVAKTLRDNKQAK